MEEALVQKLLDVGDMLKACLVQRQRCKQGLGGLQKAVRDLQKPTRTSGSSLIRDAQEECGVPVPAARRRHSGQDAQRMSDSMAMLHNNRQKLITSVEGLEAATRELRYSVVSLASSASSGHSGGPGEDCISTNDTLAGSAAEGATFQSLCEGSLVACAACEGLQEECRLWSLLGKAGRMDADPDVLYGIDEAVKTLGADLEALFVELSAAGT
eukprot:jgi/Ulvmu1/456/UM001_0463.1